MEACAGFHTDEDQVADNPMVAGGGRGRSLSCGDPARFSELVRLLIGNGVGVTTSCWLPYHTQLSTPTRTRRPRVDLPDRGFEGPNEVLANLALHDPSEFGGVADCRRIEANTGVPSGRDSPLETVFVLEGGEPTGHWVLLYQNAHVHVRMASCRHVLSMAVTQAHAVPPSSPPHSAAGIQMPIRWGEGSGARKWQRMRVCAGGVLESRGGVLHLLVLCQLGGSRLELELSDHGLWSFPRSRPVTLSDSPTPPVKLDIAGCQTPLL